MSAVTFPTSLATIDLAAVKSRQQAARADRATTPSWVPRYKIVGETLCESLELRSGSRVLDVAAGNGNATLAWRRAALVRRDLYLDDVPSLLESGKACAAAEGHTIQFRKPMRRTCHSATRRLTW